MWVGKNNLCAVGVLSATIEYNVFGLRAGGHFEAQNCQITINFIRCNTFQISIICPLAFSRCYQLAFFLIKRHIHLCHCIFLSVGLGVGKVLFFTEREDFLFFLRGGESILFCKLWFVSRLVRLAKVYALCVCLIINSFVLFQLNFLFL